MSKCCVEQWDPTRGAVTASYLHQPIQQVVRVIQDLLGADLDVRVFLQIRIYIRFCLVRQQEPDLPRGLRLRAPAASCLLLLYQGLKGLLCWDVSSAPLKSRCCPVCCVPKVSIKEK